MESFSFIGVDVSKKKLDWDSKQEHSNGRLKNTPNTQTSIIKRLRSLKASFEKKGLKPIICAAFTGRYHYPLVQACRKEGFKLWMVGGAEVKASSGVQRGKNDKVDAKRIREYAQRFCDKMELYTPDSQPIEILSDLQGERRMYISDRSKYKAQIRDMKKFMNPESYQQRAGRLKKLIAQLNAYIKKIDKRMRELIQEDNKLKSQYEIATSVTGVGPCTAIATLVATKGFTKFTSPRSFSCHAGTAPFAYSSGSSIHSKNKVSNRANKRLKTLFHMAALSAISAEGEMKEYFDKKVAQGKNKMTVLNSIRSKLIHRIFALIRDEREYDPEYRHPEKKYHKSKAA